jgi:ribonuclease HI
MLVIIEADGGARPNPGPAGSGSVLRDKFGRVIAELSTYVGETTNNVAEYKGLINGLQRAIELGATKVSARMDSKLVVEQVNCRWQVKKPELQPLVERARCLLSEFDKWELTWIPRAENSAADALATKAVLSKTTEHKLYGVKNG